MLNKGYFYTQIIVFNLVIFTMKKLLLFLPSLLFFQCIFAQDAVLTETNPAIRAREYHITGGKFSDKTYTLRLAQNLAEDYFILVRGSRTGDGPSKPDNDYVRVSAVPGGRGELSDSGATNQIKLKRHAAAVNWEGVVTVVESLPGASHAGFKLLDIVKTNMGKGKVNGTDKSNVSWSNINQVVLFGGYRGGGANFEQNSQNEEEGTSVYARIWPQKANQIKWQRHAGGRTLRIVNMTTFVVEWGDHWQVQRVYIDGKKGGNGVNAASEYATASIQPVRRENTWLWATGRRVDGGAGDCAESVVVTLGNGVKQNDVETQVAVGSEYKDRYYFEVYTMTHPGLQVDHIFKKDGNKNVLDRKLTVPRKANLGYRFAWAYNTLNGTAANGFPRQRMWTRYIANNRIALSRGYDGQPYAAWAQGIDFSRVNIPGQRIYGQLPNFSDAQTVIFYDEDGNSVNDWIDETSRTNSFLLV